TADRSGRAGGRLGSGGRPGYGSAGTRAEGHYPAAARSPAPDLDPLAPRSGDPGRLGPGRRYRRHRRAYLPIRLGTPARLRYRCLLDSPPRLDRGRDRRWRVSLRLALRPFWTPSYAPGCRRYLRPGYAARRLRQ